MMEFTTYKLVWFKCSSSFFQLPLVSCSSFALGFVTSECRCDDTGDDNEGDYDDANDADDDDDDGCKNREDDDANDENNDDNNSNHDSDH